MPFQRYRLRDSDVWARVDASGALTVDGDGRVEIVYKPVLGAKTYRAGARNLSDPSGAPIELAAQDSAQRSEAAADRHRPRGAASAQLGSASIPASAIHVWTDGGAAPNPGPSGAGIVIVDGDDTTEISEFLGHATNQIAELTAILIGLSRIEARHRPVVVYSDSRYSIGLLTQAHWKAKKNVELVGQLRALCREFRDLRFVKVAGHSGIPLNERTDALVGQAIRRGRK